jgi:predicted ATPase
MGMNIREKATSSGLTRLQRPELTTAEAIKCMVSSLLSYGPAVVVLEDLQWADPGSVEATRGLMSLALEGPLLIVLTWRHKGSQEMAVLDTALEAVPSSMTRRVELRPLSATEERDLARALLGDPADEVLDGLVDGADGNPLLLQERLATSLETKAVVKCDAGWRRLSGIRAEVPDSVQRLVQSRLDHLEPNQREALVAASVLGPDFTMASVAAVADLDIDLGQIASDLCREGLLAEAHTRPEVTYRFEHAVFRTAIYQSVLESERSRLSARAASALQSAAS